ncbi:uncharacterized protein LOC134523515 [Chroicocephalus ridibundus]|uniref:uncharacterized protein LOC134523515 n=1 Tax=Chroicocephalus ridibundus TaxID=1192867 RepID=UPI002FDDAA33
MCEAERASWAKDTNEQQSTVPFRGELLTACSPPIRGSGEDADDLCPTPGPQPVEHNFPFTIRCNQAGNNAESRARASRGRGRGWERGWLRPSCHLTLLRSKSQNLEVSLPAGEAVKALEKWLALGEESWSLKCPDWKGKAHFSSIFNSSSFASDPRELRLAPGCPSAAPSKAPLSPAAGTQHNLASARAETRGKTTHDTNPARRRTHIAQLPSRSSGGTRHRVKWLNRVKHCCGNWSVFKAEPWGGVRQPHGNALCKP